jgi:aspartate beta-hydroxylase
MDRASQTRAAVEALRRGDARQARLTFERIVAAGEADAGAYLGLAYACAALKDRLAALAAVDRALALQPRDLRALILKADQLAESGDARAAASFYRAAVNASPPAHELPAELRGEVRRAAAMCERYGAQFEAFLNDRLQAVAGTSGRFRDSLEILAGRKKVYLQEPRQYFFPGLPQIQFYERTHFPWLERLEAATAQIREELLEVMREEKQAFRPYVEADPRLPYNEAQGMLNNPQWSAFYLWKHGELVTQNAARCPRTVSALAEVPFARVKGRSPSVLFSLLRAGARIPPHTGEVNTRLICHLPLVVPEKCAFRVGNDTRTPVEGKAWVFDDTIEHEAWNDSDRTRVILLFEIWRPELTSDERALVSAMFEAIDAYGGAAMKSDL